MPEIKWDDTGKRLYETGVDHGVLYLINENNEYTDGVAWNGLVNVNESPSGAEANPQYADDIKYLNVVSAEEFAATIEAFTYPNEFAECDGSKSPVDGVYVGQQNRRKFGFTYRTKIGNDVKGIEYGYKLHLIYGCQASPSEKAYGTINESPEAITFSWEVTTEPVPVNLDGYKPTACITIDSTKFADVDGKAKLDALEALLYAKGSNAKATLPNPTTVFTTLGMEIDDDGLTGDGN